MILFGLLKKSILITKASLKSEVNRSSNIKNPDEIAFLPAAIEIQEKPPSPLGRLLLAIIIILFSSVIAWSWLGQLDTVAVAQGKLITDGKSKIIQAVDAGVIKNINVVDGELVTKGDVLVEIDPTEEIADETRLKEDLVAVKLDIARHRALISSPRNPIITIDFTGSNSQNLFWAARELMEAEAKEQIKKLETFKQLILRGRAELSTIKARIKRYSNTIPLLEKRVAAHVYLGSKNIVSKLKVNTVQEELLGRKQDLVIQEKLFAEKEQQINVLRSEKRTQVANFLTQNTAALNIAIQKKRRLEQEITKAKERRLRQVLTAPVSGTVQQLAINTVGGVVRAAQELMVVVPAESKLEVEGAILNKDIGFIEKGQTAVIKFESFQFTKFGSIPGKVSYISVDSVNNERLGLVYPIRLELLKTKILVGDRWVKFAPGMSVTIEVKTGKRRIIDYFLSPIIQHTDESLRER